MNRSKNETTESTQMIKIHDTDGEGLKLGRVAWCSVLSVLLGL